MNTPTNDDFLRRPYHILLVRDQDSDGNVGWVASVEELRGCLSQGDTPEEAASMIYEAMGAWLGVALAHGDPIPEPRPEPSFSGRFLVRLPATLHEALDRGAKREGVSLNQYVSTLLAGAIGWSQETAASRRRTA